MKNRILKLRYLYFKDMYGKNLSKILSIINWKIYLPCFEIPITTFCTLRCKNCSNLIQYYDKPYNVKKEDILHDIRKVLSAVDKIGCVRILGGEPILSPALSPILKLLIWSHKVDNILIVTNGTLLFSEEVLKIIEKTSKVKVSISNYNDKSKELKNLENQLRVHGIKFETRNVKWREKSSINKNGLNNTELKNFFEICPNKFFSLLNGKIHICPKSAHATDLGLIKTTDFVNLRNIASSKEIRKEIIRLLKKSFIETCKYCNEYDNTNLRIVISGEQCSKAYAMKQLENMRRNLAED